MIAITCASLYTFFWVFIIRTSKNFERKHRIMVINNLPLLRAIVSLWVYADYKDKGYKMRDFRCSVFANTTLWAIWWAIQSRPEQQFVGAYYPYAFPLFTHWASCVSRWVLQRFFSRCYVSNADVAGEKYSLVSETSASIGVFALLTNRSTMFVCPNLLSVAWIV